MQRRERTIPLQRIMDQRTRRHHVSIIQQPTTHPRTRQRRILTIQPLRTIRLLIPRHPITLRSGTTHLRRSIIHLRRSTTRLRGSTTRLRRSTTLHRVRHRTREAEDRHIRSLLIRAHLVSS